MTIDRHVLMRGFLGLCLLGTATDLTLAAGQSQPQAAAPAAAPGSTHERDSVSQEAAAALLRERQALVREAMTANEDMLLAIVGLDHGDKDIAYKALADASGKLDVVLARDPQMKRVPISVRATTSDLESGPKSVGKALADAKEQLSKGNVQAAKALLHPLSSEIRITTESLPMDTYPAAIKQATKEIQAGKGDDAARLLANTLTSIVTTEKVIPLPPLKAEADVQEAEALIKADPVKNRGPALDLVNQARRQLEVGKLLGYGEYKDVEQEMTAVQDKLHGGSSDSGLFARLKNLLHEARGRSHAGLDRPVHGAVGIGPHLEAAEVVDLGVAEVLEQLAGERRASAGGAIQDDGLGLGEVLVVVGRLGIGTKFQHPARDVHGARDLAALFHLRRVAHVDEQRIAAAHQFVRLSRGDLRHDGVRGVDQLFDGECHGVSLMEWAGRRKALGRGALLLAGGSLAGAADSASPHF